MMAFEVTSPDCFDQALGIIRINATGGVPPYQYAKDGATPQASNEFHALGDGIYQFDVIDANGCTTAEIISIDVPLMISVDLGSDQSISLGDTTDINAIVNLPLDSISSIAWTGIDTSGCENCLHQVVAPVITTAYSVMVSSVDGCADRDTMIVNVTSEQQLYIPNIFSPNGDGVNDMLRISADEGVQEIAVMEIFDRWGNLVFGFTSKKPDDPAAQWDGLFKGERMNPGVFTYKMIILNTSGEREVRYGDITLLR
jgi:gliding motility-associated-like protein